MKLFSKGNKKLFKKKNEKDSNQAGYIVSMVYLISGIAVFALTMAFDIFFVFTFIRALFV